MLRLEQLKTAEPEPAILYFNLVAQYPHYDNGTLFWVGYFTRGPRTNKRAKGTTGLLSHVPEVTPRPPNRGPPRQVGNLSRHDEPFHGLGLRLLGFRGLVFRVHGFMGSWVHGFTGSRVHGFTGSWVHGFMGSWVSCLGVAVQGLGNTGDEVYVQDAKN